ncbi:hypothetical protein Tco_1507428 [Tanacetum coccineum]
MDSTKIIFKRVTRFIPIPRARFEITIQLCFFDGSKPKNNDELQPRLSNFFKNFDSNGGDDLCYQGGLDQRLKLGRKCGALLKLCGGFRELMHSAFIGTLAVSLGSLNESAAHLHYCVAVLGTRSEVRRTKEKCAVLWHFSS